MTCMSAQGAATLHTCTVRLSLFDVPPATFPTPTTLSYRVSRLTGYVRRTVKNVAGSFAPAWCGLENHCRKISGRRRKRICRSEERSVGKDGRYLCVMNHE